jgi:hypothetical protein
MIWTVYWFFFFVVLAMLGSFAYFIATAPMPGSPFEEKVEKWWEWFSHLY